MKTRFRASLSRISFPGGWSAPGCAHRFDWEEYGEH